MLIKDCLLIYGMEMGTGVVDSSFAQVPSKVKPYNVVDLSTRQTLSEEEVYKCLKEAAIREVSKLEGHYYRYLDQPVKPNGDAPNFINLPPKQRSKSFDSLHAQLRHSKREWYEEIEYGGSGYDLLPYRERSKTAPANYTLIRSESKQESTLVRSSRPVVPSSPGSAKRKIQQKLQRDGKHQNVGSRSSTSKASPSASQKSHSRIPSSKHYAPSGLSMSEKPNDRKDSHILESGSDNRSNTSHSNVPTLMNKCTPSNYRSNLCRLSSKNSDTGSECSSDSGSCRSTPVYGSPSPIGKRSFKKGEDSPPNLSGIPQARGNSGIPMKSKYATLEKQKRSDSALPIRREHTFDNVRQRKVSSPPILISNLQQSCNDISTPQIDLSNSIYPLGNPLSRNASNSSIPLSRSRNSSECSHASQEESSGNLKLKFESLSSIGTSRQSSIESCASDSSDISKLSSGSKIPSSLTRPGSNMQKKASTVSKQRTSGIPSAMRKLTTKESEAKVNSNHLSVSKPCSGQSSLKKPTSPMPCIKTKTSDAGNDPNVTVASAKKNIGAKKSAIRPPSSLIAAEKKSIESPLTHRRKLVYSNPVKSQPIQQNVVKTIADSTSAVKSDLSEIDNSSKEMSKIRQPSSSNLSPASRRYSSKINSLQYATKLQPPSKSLSGNEHKNANENKGVDNSLDRVILHNEDTQIDTEDALKEDNITEKNIDAAQVIDCQVKAILTDNSKEKELASEKVSKQSKEPVSYVIEKDFRTESTNSSRSSELDDGYSSLHKLDNLSPTLEDECSDKKVADIIADKKIRMDKEISTEEHHGQINSLYKDCINDDKGVCQAIDRSSYIYAKPNKSMKKHAVKLESPDLEGHNDYGGKPSPEYDGLQSPHINDHSVDSPVQSSLLVSPDPFGKDFEEFNRSVRESPVCSPFKRVHPKVLIPPPPLNSIANDGGLAPVPSEYMRTPSSDGDEMLLSNYYSGDLRRRAREQAKKVWTKNARFQEYSDYVRNPEPASRREKMESDVFYCSKDIEKKTIDVPSKYATRTSVHRSYETSHGDAIFQIEDVGTEMEKKKKSKLKKFLRKLSTKKEGRTDCDSRIGIGSERFSADSYSLASVNSLPSHLQNLVYPEGSDSYQDTHVGKSPSSKRRMFTFNLSFKKKVRRHRSDSVFTDDSTDVLSNTVRALCSPEMNRRKELNFLRNHRRGSDPSAYQFQQSAPSSIKNSRVPNPPNSPSEVCERVGRGYCKNDADYINYPFSKFNIKAPVKPQRQSTQKVSSANRCSNQACSAFDGTADCEGQKMANDFHVSCSSNENDGKCLDLRTSSESSDKSAESMVLSQSISSRSTGSLRRTPLRSNDNYSKLLEVHKQTIDKIAYEIASLRCECESLRGLEWEDFERVEEMIQLGLNSYMVVPVTCAHKSLDKRTFYAWLHLSPQHAVGQLSEYPIFNFSTSTLHRNCLHACHIIEQNYSSPFQDGIPKSIQVDCVYISTQCPKMTLSKYISLTLEKHARYPEIYEREVALMLLQILKGIQNLYTNDVFISSIDSDSIFVMNNGEPSVVLSPRREPNRCPALAVSVLPGIGDCFRQTAGDTISSVCHQLAFLLYELMHSPYQDELGDAIDMSMLLATLPDLTIKSIYSRYLQYVINILLGSSSHTMKSLEDLQIILEIILFGPSDISDCSENETIVLINKWHNRRCVDMVTHILKEAPLIMLCASGPTAHDIEKIKNVDQEILLECEFLSYATSSDIYRVSKMLNR